MFSYIQHTTHKSCTATESPCFSVSVISVTNRQDKLHHQKVHLRFKPSTLRKSKFKMVKLSYAGRKVQGLKLGQAVARDLRKRIPPGSGARAAARDPTIELDLTGKLLTDDGLKEIIDALVSCIKFQDENYPNGVIKLTELSLKGNALTTTAIARLAKVVELSKSSLVKLDISDNGISIISKTQRSNWRIFLKSFEECYMLKSIDFSGNKLGSAGFDGISEVFLKSELYFIVPSPARIPDENGKLHSVGGKLKSISLNTNGNDTLRLPAAGEANCRHGGMSHYIRTMSLKTR
ncbi:hypothetical protein CIHG_06062 [Coccidioides immitis H538.4]|uniref:Uncharacterized protein n=1 Tax=Coccidioides immitis H538.4 TaxID=396776 RepID=A0A0J8RUH0_COCIT|nr:hypothetical protein CIHG_06062 [Coccidioides immitis H538.4]